MGRLFISVYILDFLKELDKEARHLFKTYVRGLTHKVLSLLEEKVREEARLFIHSPIRGKSKVLPDVKNLLYLSGRDLFEETLKVVDLIRDLSKEIGREIIIFSEAWKEVAESAIKLLQARSENEAMYWIDRIKDLVHYTGKVLPEISNLAKWMEGRKIEELVMYADSDIRRLYSRLKFAYPSIRKAQLKISEPMARFVHIGDCLGKIIYCLKESGIELLDFSMSKSEADGGRPERFAELFMNFWTALLGGLSLFETFLVRQERAITPSDATVVRNLLRKWEKFVKDIKERYWDPKIKIIWGKRDINDLSDFLMFYPYKHIWDNVKNPERIWKSCSHCVYEIFPKLDWVRVRTWEQYLAQLQRIFNFLTRLVKEQAELPGVKKLEGVILILSANMFEDSDIYLKIAKRLRVLSD